MAAYMIVAAKIHDRDAFISGYGKAAAELIPEFGGKYLLRAPGAIELEGNFGNASLVISEWPDKETLMKFWNSPEYTEVKKLRENIADCQIFVIEAPSITEQ